MGAKAGIDALPQSPRTKKVFEWAAEARHARSSDAQATHSARFAIAARTSEWVWKFAHPEPFLFCEERECRSRRMRCCERVRCMSFCVEFVLLDGYRDADMRVIIHVIMSLMYKVMAIGVTTIKTVNITVKNDGTTTIWVKCQKKVDCGSDAL